MLSLGPTHSFPAERGVRLPALGDGARPADPGACSTRRCSRFAGAGTPAGPWRCYAGAAARVPPRLQRMQAEDLIAVVLSRPARLSRERSPAIARSPTIPWWGRRSDDCLRRGDGHRALESLLREIEAGEKTSWSCASCASRRRWPTRSSTPNPTPFSTTRRSRSVERRRSTRGAGSILRRRPTWAGSTTRRSSVCAAEAWPEVTSADELHDVLVTFGLLHADRPVQRGVVRRAGRSTAGPRSCATPHSEVGSLRVGDRTRAAAPGGLSGMSRRCEPRGSPRSPHGPPDSRMERREEGPGRAAPREDGESRSRARRRAGGRFRVRAVAPSTSRWRRSRVRRLRDARSLHARRRKTKPSGATGACSRAYTATR